MVTYTKQKKEIQLSCFVGEDEAEKIRELAQKQNRSVSNFLYSIYKQVIEKPQRDKIYLENYADMQKEENH